MPRKPRALVDQGIYHIFNRGNNKMSLFKDAVDFDCFRDHLSTSVRFHQAKLYHYCLMTNHFHFLLQIQKAEDLAKIMHEVQLKYARYFKKKSGFLGHVFQERFRSPQIAKESYYLQCGRYIERNPVKAGIVRHPEDYLYSSAPYYVLGKKDELITPNLYYRDLGANEEERQRRYKEFVQMEEPYQGLIDKSIQYT